MSVDQISLLLEAISVSLPHVDESVRASWKLFSSNSLSANRVFGFSVYTIWIIF